MQSRLIVRLPIVIWFCLLLTFIFITQHTPHWLRLMAIDIHLKPDDSVVLGSQELASPFADKQHVKIKRTHDGQWNIENISLSKKVLHTQNNVESLIRSIPVATGDTFKIASSEFKVITMDASNNSLLLVATASAIRYEMKDGLLYKNQQALPACEASKRTDINYITQLKQKATDPVITLGGTVDCGLRIAVTETQSQVATLTLNNGQWYLSANFKGDVVDISVTPKQTAESTFELLTHQRTLLNNDSLIIGYTHFRIKTTASQLTLIPTENSRKVLITPGNPPNFIKQKWEPVTWHYTHAGFSPLTRKSFIALAVLSLIVIILSAIFKGSRLHNTRQLAQVLVGFSLGGSIFAFTLFAIAPIPLLAFGAFFLAAFFWALQTDTDKNNTLIKSTTLLLIGSGLMLQTQLSLGSPDEKWQIYSVKTAAAAAAGMGLCIALTAWVRLRPRQIRLPSTLLQTLLVFFTGGVLATQLLIGDEAGLGIFQPVELSKTVLIILIGIAFAHRMAFLGKDTSYNTRQITQLWLSYLVTALLFCGVFAIISLFLNDYSPVILLGFLGIGSLTAYGLTAWKGIYRWLTLTFPILAIYMVGNADTLQKTIFHSILPQVERLEVWADPLRHPHSGYQFNTAQEFIQQGGWTGRYLGEALKDIPLLNGNINSLPAVQDDFMASFALYQLGPLFTLPLVITQCLFVAALIIAATKIELRFTDRGIEYSTVGKSIYFMLCSAAALFVGHFIVSWGTNLGFLPVMGQPMPFMSSAGSHLLLFCIPPVMLALLSSEENLHA